MLTAALVVRNLGFLLYGGPLLAFTALIAAAPLIPHLRLWHLVRAYRAWGAGLGLSLGATIFGLLASRWLEHGAFRWGWSTPGDQLDLAAWLAFFALWVSNIKLEIWTLEPLRKLDHDGSVADEAAYRAAAGRLLRHLGAHAALIVAVVALFTALDAGGRSP